MLTHPSSISSFSLRLARWGTAMSQASRSPLVWSLALAIVVFVGAELAARWLLQPYQTLWAYWQPESGANFEELKRQVLEGRCPELLIVGDSTAQSNFLALHLAPLCSRDDTVWNLGCPGGFARAFHFVTMPLLEDARCRPRMVIASFLPSAFTDAPGAIHLENRILESPYGRRAQGKFHLGYYLHLARAWPALRVWKAQRDGKVQRVAINRGFEPRTRTVDLSTEPPPQSLPTTLNPDRLKVIEQLAAWAANRHVALVIVVPPTLDQTPARQSVDQQFRQYLESLKNQYPLEWVNANDMRWTEREFADLNHLNVQGASRLTSTLAKQARELLIAKDGTMSPSATEGKSSTSSAKPTDPQVGPATL